MGALGLLLSLVTFFRSEVGGRKSKEEILNALEQDKTIRDYLEWLRRQDTAELLQNIDQSKTQLLGLIGELGDSLSPAIEKILARADEATAQIQALNERVALPVLSPIAISTRYAANITLRGREQELKRLQSDSDTLVFGQPGSGKTSLIQVLAYSIGAQFILSEDADSTIAAIILQRPNTVIIDDAGPRQELIRRLQHAREERGIKFRIIAVCWPFEKAELQQALQITDEQTMELSGLPRKIIAEVIGEIAQKKHVKLSDDFIRVVAKQARGKPGLAASLTLATLESSGEALVSGELLLKDLEGFLRRHGGEECIDVLAAFACGGSAGISTESVAKNLGKPITEVMVTTRRVALAGVLQEIERDTLLVRPGFLRSALLKTSFFPTSGPALPWNLCRSLVESGKQPVLGYLDLIYARSRSAASISNDKLRPIVVEVDDYRLWEAMACVDEGNCRWVIETKKDLSADIKRAALHYHPKLIIPMMLTVASTDNRPLNAFPNADMRLLEDWVTGGDDADAVRRRQIMFDTATNWMKSGGDALTGITALSFVFNLKCHKSDSDPADPNIIRWRDWLLSITHAKEVFALWNDLIALLKSLRPIPWSKLINLVETWLHVTRPRGQALPQNYIDFIDESSRMMISSLVPLASNQQAALRWLSAQSKNVGLVLENLPLSSDFMVLFPEERLDGNWEERERLQISAVEKLADDWSKKPFSELIQTLSEWQIQIDQLARVWPQWSGVFCSRLATLYKPSDPELSLAIDKLAPSNVAPFLEAAASDGTLKEEHVKDCLKRPELEGVLVDLVLSGKLSNSYTEIQPKLRRWKGLIEARCLRAEVPDNVIGLLLTDPESVVRLETALGMFHARNRKPIPAQFESAWANAIIEGVALVATNDIDARLYDLNGLFNYKPEIKRPILDRILSTGGSAHSIRIREIFPSLVSGLDKESRRELLRNCRSLSYSSLPGLIVGHDADLYTDLLAMPELKQFHLDPLIGDPNHEDWVGLAKLALAAGYSPKDLAFAVNAGGFSWTGHLSNYYDKWVQSFQQLSQREDRDLKAIAVEGLNWATAARDGERKTEKMEEIEGWD
jgi:hypothetical protein